MKINNSETEQEAPERGSLNWSFVVRMALATASIAAAVFLMTASWPADLARRWFANVEYGSPAGGIGDALQLAQNVR